MADLDHFYLEANLRLELPYRRIAQLESAPTTPGRSQVRFRLRLPVSYENRRPANSGQDYRADRVGRRSDRIWLALRYRCAVDGRRRFPAGSSSTGSAIPLRSRDPGLRVGALLLRSLRSSGRKPALRSLRAIAAGLGDGLPLPSLAVLLGP